MIENKKIASATAERRVNRPMRRQPPATIKSHTMPALIVIETCDGGGR